MRYEAEETVATLLKMMPLDRLIRTAEELEEAVRDARDWTMVTLWVAEGLEEEVRRRVVGASDETTPLAPTSN